MDKELAGKRLIIFAWIVEVCAVCVGLLIALMIGARSFDEIKVLKDISGDAVSFVDYTNTLLGALPFIMVAIVELTKIPMASAYYHAKRTAWKVLFAIALIFLAMITFETAFNGFEQNFARLSYSVEKFFQKIVTVEENIALLEKSKTEREKLTINSIEDNYVKRSAQIQSDYNKQVTLNSDREAQLNSQVNTEIVIDLKKERISLQDEVKFLRENRQAKIEDARSRADKKIAGSVEDSTQKRSIKEREIEDLDNDIAAAEQEATAEISRASFLTRTSVRQRNDKKLFELKKMRESLYQQLAALTSNREIRGKIDANLADELSKIETEFDADLAVIKNQIKEVREKITNATSTRQKDVDPQLAELSRNFQRLNDAKDKQMKENEGERDRQLNTLKNNDAAIEVLKSKLKILNDERNSLRNDVNEKVAGTQVYRITQWWTGAKAAADLERKDVARTAAVWFGSLAAIVAFTGTILALGGLVLQDDAKQHEPKGKTRRSLRRAFVAFQKRMKEPKIITREVKIIREVPKEVIKEVPVDKIVFKEIPVEIIKRVLVHVPMYTNDENKLNIQAAGSKSKPASVG
ncbi:hypothetical protein N9A51_01450 [Pseudomonadales bacterium]|nr:hypothetical protein [Pseudomonadales bacterium]